MEKRLKVTAKGKQPVKVKVSITYAPAPDYQQRLRKVMALLLRRIAEKPSARGTHEAAGDGGCKDGNEWNLPDQ